jgi:hypothetical protein
LPWAAGEPLVPEGSVDWDMGGWAT